MMMYAIAILPLIHALVDKTKWNENWYADECAGKLKCLKEWFEVLR